MTTTRTADLVIVGGGISGAALLFAAARYSSISRITLIEKYHGLAQVNSAATHNSQTLHCGDIETNYTLAKALKVKRAAALVLNYARRLAPDESLLHRYSKMVLGVGPAECARLRTRYAEFAPHYPGLRLFDPAEIARVEPRVALAGGRPRPEEIVACGVEHDYTAANFAALTQSFANHARAAHPNVQLALGQRATAIRAVGDHYQVLTDRET